MLNLQPRSWRARVRNRRNSPRRNSREVSESLGERGREKGRESYPAALEKFPRVAGNFRLRPTRRTLENIAPQPVNNYPRWRAPPTRTTLCIVIRWPETTLHLASDEFLITRVNIIKIVQHRVVVQLFFFFFCSLLFLYCTFKVVLFKNIMWNILFHFLNSRILFEFFQRLNISLFIL